MDHNLVTREDFERLKSGMKFEVVETLSDLNRHFARVLVDMIKHNNERGEKTRIILPVGPLDYEPFVDMCNEQAVSCKDLVIFMMDEYCFVDGSAIPRDHPLSFHGFMDREFFSRLESDLRPLPDHVYFPDPEDLGLPGRMMKEHGGIDACFGGSGINGHFAFNEPPAQGESHDVESFRELETRVVTLTPESMTQMAMGGTGGNYDIIPPKGVTLGMRELLSAASIHLYYMRTWHSAVMRRALFGPVSPSFPSSLVQTHPNVAVTMVSYVAELPMINVTQHIGE